MSSQAATALGRLATTTPSSDRIAQVVAVRDSWVDIQCAGATLTNIRRLVSCDPSVGDQVIVHVIDDVWLVADVIAN